MQLQEPSGDSRDYFKEPDRLKNPWDVLRRVRMRHLVRHARGIPKMPGNALPAIQGGSILNLRLLLTICSKDHIMEQSQTAETSSAEESAPAEQPAAPEATPENPSVADAPAEESPAADPSPEKSDAPTPSAGALDLSAEKSAEIRAASTEDLEKTLSEMRAAAKPNSMTFILIGAVESELRSRS